MGVLVLEIKSVTLGKNFFGNLQKDFTGTERTLDRDKTPCGVIIIPYWWTP